MKGFVGFPVGFPAGFPVGFGFVVGLKLVNDGLVLSVESTVGREVGLIVGFVEIIELVLVG